MRDYKFYSKCLRCGYDLLKLGSKTCCPDMRYIHARDAFCYGFDPAFLCYGWSSSVLLPWNSARYRLCTDWCGRVYWWRDYYKKRWNLIV